MGRMVKIGAISGYLGRPSGEGPWPTVLVIHEWYGLTNQYRIRSRPVCRSALFFLRPRSVSRGNGAAGGFTKG